MLANSLKGRRGFQLLELLVALGIIGLLLSLLMPAVQNARAAANRLTCQANLREIGLAIHNYNDIFGNLPPTVVYAPSQAGNTAPLNWTAALLPYISQESLWKSTAAACTVDPITYDVPPHVGLSTVVRLYVCPSDSRLLEPQTDQNGITAAYTSYIGVAGGSSLDGVMLTPPIRLTDITDGTSNTLMVGERPPPSSLAAGWWYTLLASLSWPDARDRGPDASMVVAAQSASSPCAGPFHFGPGRVDNPCDRYHFWSMHTGGANFLFADGSVRFVPYSASSILPGLATRAGNEDVYLAD